MEKEPEKTSNDAVEPKQPTNESSEEQTVPQKEKEEAAVYLRAMPLKDLSDVEKIESEVRKGNIIILKITPLANKNLPDVSQAVDELYSFTKEIGGDIARLGEERIVLCPQEIRIWREKAPAQNQAVPTAA